MRISVLLLLAIFTFQILDVPPAGNRPNPHTCCGRVICKCRHESGAFCPFRHGLSDDFKAVQVSMENPAVSAQHAHCHLMNADKTSENSKIRMPSPSAKFVFTKAPCASDTPKTVLPEYSKDFLFPASAEYFILRKQGIVPALSIKALLLLREQGLERPPRFF